MKKISMSVAKSKFDELNNRLRRDSLVLDWQELELTEFDSGTGGVLEICRLSAWQIVPVVVELCEIFGVNTRESGEYFNCRHTYENEIGIRISLEG